MSIDNPTVVCSLCGNTVPILNCYSVIPFSSNPNDTEPPEEEFYCKICYTEEEALNAEMLGIFWRGPSDMAEEA